MSSVVIAGDVAGSITLQAPSSAGSAVLTLPATTATLLTDSSGILNIGSGQVYKDASGNVGIGTALPLGKLQVSGATAPLTGGYGQLNIFSTDAIGGDKGGKISFGGVSGASGFDPYGFCSIAGYKDNATASNFSGYLQFSTANSGGTVTERMRIDSSGNVGIGTTSPTAVRTKNLEVSSTGTNDGAAVIVNKRGTGIATLRLGTSGAATGFDVNFNFPNTGDLGFYDLAAAANRMIINSSGIVTMAAYGAGAATFSAAGVISSVSDETWKIKDGVPVDADSMLKKLEPGYWYYNNEKKEIFGTDRQLGFYAQNVNEAIGPEAAPTPEEGKPWGYYDRSVLAVTVMSLQKALTTIEALTERLTALEAK